VAANASELAAVIVEPVAANMASSAAAGVPMALRETTRACGALLIFDEVITGFRLGRAARMGRFAIEPDLTCLGKIIGGGLPVGPSAPRRRDGAARSRRPGVPAGTLAGNPVTMAAAARLSRSWTAAAYAHLETLEGPDGRRSGDGSSPVTVSRMSCNVSGRC